MSKESKAPVVKMEHRSELDPPLVSRELKVFLISIGLLVVGLVAAGQL